jgi:hypothetical protein
VLLRIMHVIIAPTFRAQARIASEEVMAAQVTNPETCSALGVETCALWERLAVLVAICAFADLVISSAVTVWGSATADLPFGLKKMCAPTSDLLRCKKVQRADW